MSSLVKTVAIVGRSLRATPASQRIRLFDVSARRNMGSQAQLPWNYLWQPGPYPRTKEECDAAAKKYVSPTKVPLSRFVLHVSPLTISKTRISRDIKIAHNILSHLLDWPILISSQQVPCRTERMNHRDIKVKGINFFVYIKPGGQLFGPAK